jgi:hypothetical protein
MVMIIRLSELFSPLKHEEGDIMKQVQCFLLIIMCLLIVACTPKIIAVTQEIKIPVTQIAKVTVEVEVTRVVQKEVTREVIIQPTVTPTPIEYDPSVAFSLNYLGTMEQDGIKVELARVVFAQRDALKPDISFDDNPLFNNANYVGEIIWRISNNTPQRIQWSYDDINVRVNDRQIKLHNYLINGFGELPTNPIFPGSTIIGGVWFGIDNIKPNEITGVSLLLGSPTNSDTYKSISRYFILSADLSGDHKWNPSPEELR